jgi:PPP family 3-phenylpropionic acid transporter
MEMPRAQAAKGLSALVRSGAAYCVLHAGPGALSPFMGLWLKAQGFSPVQIGLIIATPLFGRIVLARPLGLWVDRYERLRAPLVVLCLTAAGASAALTVSHPFWLVLCAWFIGCTCIGACTPLLDVATLTAAARSGFAFSAARSAASLATIIGGVALGALLTAQGQWVLPLWGLMGGVAAAILVARLVTAENSDKYNDGKASLRTPVGERPGLLLVMVLTAAGLIQLSHGLNSFAMLSWRTRGIDAGWCGLLWQTGVAADVVFLWALGRHPVAPSRLLVLGGLGAVLRWAMFALSPPLPVLFLVQPLHALSFTATYVASVQLIDRLVADRDHLVVQAYYWAISTGLCTGAGVVGAGFLYQRLGTDGYWLMCALALAGLAAALALHLRIAAPRAPRLIRMGQVYAK